MSVRSPWFPTDREETIQVLSRELGLEEGEVRRKVEKRSSREVIASNVEKETGDRIRGFHLDGVKVDEDYKRYYPYDSLASRVLGFTGGDNQGIIGLEVKYEEYLKGENGTIFTLTDAAGVELENGKEERLEPTAGRDLILSLDVNIQQYAQQLAYQTMEKKNAKGVSIIVMNPQNGEILAMVNAPDSMEYPHPIAEEKNSIPNRPYTIEGIPESVSAVTRTTLTSLFPFFAYSTR